MTVPRLFFLSLALLLALPVAAQDFAATLTASDGTNTLGLTLGTDARGTDGYDDGLDTYAPPLPPDGAFDARFRTSGEDYLTDIRSDAAVKKTFTLLYQPADGAGPITLNWDASALAAAGGFRLVDRATGGDDFSLDMTTTGSLDVSTTGGALDDGAQIVFTPAGANNAPTAQDDAATTDEDTAATIDVRANDSDADGDPLSVSLTAQPSNGTATLESDTTVTYTPNADFNGSDSFTYQVSDGRGGTATATVTVTVTPVNDAPAFTTTPETAATEEEAYTYAIATTDADGDALTITAPTKPGWLTLTDHGDGTATLAGTPGNDDVGGNAVVLRAHDGTVGTDQAFTLTVANVNDAPVAAADAATTDEDVATTIDVLANDSDADGDALTVTITTDPSEGTAEVETDGQITYTPAANFNGTDSFTYQAADGNGGMATATVTITVDPVNDAPAFTTTPTTGITKNQAYRYEIGVSDVEGDALTITAPTKPGWLTLTDHGDGTATLAGTPGNDDVGGNAVVLRAHDGTVGTDQAFTLTVANVNDAPVAAADAATTDEDVATTIDVLANDSDADGDALTVTITTDPSEGTAEVETDGQITYTPAADFNGTDSFAYEISDGKGGLDTATVALTIVAVNDAPAFTTTPETAATEDVAYTYAVAVSDADGDALTITAPTKPGWLTLTDHGDGTATLSGTPAGSDMGANAVVLRAHDGTVDTDQPFTINVEEVNDRPVAQDDAATTFEDNAVGINALANDTDGDGDPLTLRLVTPPQHGTATLATNGTPDDPSDDLFTYDPNDDFNGSDAFTYEISDGRGGLDTAQVTITVTPVADAPRFTSTAPKAATEDQPYTYPITTTDADGDALTISAPTKPDWLTLTDGGDGTATLSGTPTDTDLGPHAVELDVTDGSNTARQSFILTVSNVNDVPVAADDAATTAEDTAIEIDVRSNDTDGDGDALTVTQASSASHGTTAVQPAGTVRYTPHPNYHGPDSFTYTVSDGNGGFGQATVTVTVTPTPDAPTAPPLRTPTNGASVEVSGDPAALLEIHWGMATDADGDTVRYVWQLATLNTFASGTVLQVVPTDTARTLALDYRSIADLLDAQGVPPGGSRTLFHRVTATDGTLTTASAAFSLTLTRGALTHSEAEADLPEALTLAPNYPNPFNPTTTIRFGLPQAETVQLEVFDLLGQRVAVLADGPHPAGYHEVRWHALRMSSGVYIYVLRTGSQTRTGRMLLVK